MVYKQISILLRYCVKVILMHFVKSLTLDKFFCIIA